ncbi:MAG: DNA ligase D [Ferruginibacter sp.]|nr:DNA ligase D [Ferruginibacter sp.]
MSKLLQYNKKRNFTSTREPAGAVEKETAFRFVVQKHHASHLHYDLRFQLDGVLKSWAVPKGPSETPGEKRLAVMVEDHPVSYINFKGIIPKGNYGAGKVEIWDKGEFIPMNEKAGPVSEKQAITNLKNGELKFEIKGKKLKGSYVLVRMKDTEKNWLLIKHKESPATVSTEAIANSTKNSAAVRFYGTKLNDFIKPMLAHTSEKLFSDEEWIYEIKWDGYRAIAEIGKENRFYSRNGVSFIDRFPNIFAAFKKIKHPCIIDGEVVWLAETGHANFQQLQHYDPSIKGSLVLQAFDLLSLDNKDTRHLDLLERKELLKKLLGRNTTIRYTAHIVANGEAFFKETTKLKMEGIMAKKADSTYTDGIRTRAWLKIKNVQTDDVYIAGFTAPKGARAKFGSLILAIKKGNKWQYAGHVGTGFNNSGLKEIHELLLPLVTDKNPFGRKIPVNDTPTWVKPGVVVEISFTEVTKDGIFRHPSFKRIRDDKIQVPATEPASEKKVNGNQKEIIKAGNIEVTVTNMQKVFWPKEGYTKGDMVNYYREMAPYILPYLKDRPLSLKRNPNGILDEGFYHKDAGENAPAFVKVFPYKNEKKTIDYIVCNNAATLLYLANLGCIEFNPWNNRLQHINEPDWLLIDLDPSKKNSFDQVTEVAKAAKQLMDKAKLKGYCKTSGASGIHIYLPLHASYNYHIVKNFAEIFMHLLHELVPAFTSMERSLAKRGNNIYLDYLQNRTGQTLATAYSIRPVPGATVSTPLEWKELKAGLHPADFNFKNILKRIEKKGDLFKPVLSEKNNLHQALKLLKT